jgi:Colicin V production protein
MSGSPQWQQMFVVFSLVWLLVSALRGWSNGLLRQLVLPLALLLAAVAVQFLLPWATAKADAFHLPDFLVLPVSAIFLWLLAYSIFNLIGHLLFKRTRDVQSPLGRLVFGLGGATLGLVYGLFAIWLLAIGLRVTARFIHEQPFGSGSNLFLRNVAKLSASIELGPGKQLLDSIDPVPSLCSTLGVPGSAQARR